VEQLRDDGDHLLIKVAAEELVGALIHQTLVDQQKLASAELAASNTYASVSAIPIIGQP